MHYKNMANRMNISMDRVGQFVECNFKTEPSDGHHKLLTLTSITHKTVAAPLAVSPSSSVASATTAKIGSPKLGSRRIFTPQFKLQVLDSYRCDPDCKGNQRATSRKYGIHRRQIQKWLQCESNLRLSVTNSNKNVITKHGAPSQQVAYHHSHHHHQHHHHPESKIIPAVKSISSNTCTTSKLSNTNKILISADGYGAPVFSSAAIITTSASSSFTPTLSELSSAAAATTTTHNGGGGTSSNNSTTVCLTTNYSIESKTYTTATAAPIQPHEQQIHEIHYNRIPSRNCSSSNTNCSCNDYANNFTYHPYETQVQTMISPALEVPPPSASQPIDLSLHRLATATDDGGDADDERRTQIIPQKSAEWHVTNGGVTDHQIKITSEAWDLSCRKRHLSSPPSNNESTDNASTPPKSVKLFKPYLLDDDDDDQHHDDDNNTDNITIKDSGNTTAATTLEVVKNDDSETTKIQDSIIWRNHAPTSPVYDSYLYPSPEACTSYPPSNFYTYPISYDITSFWCAASSQQASPISGYESSTSTYSDLSDPYMPPSPPIITAYPHHVSSHHRRSSVGIYDNSLSHHSWLENTSKFQHNMILTN